jgi:hypothetical protein
MAEKLAVVHPLFDPSSVYNRMRWPECVELKMFGYLTFLWGRVEREPESHPAPKEHSPEELSRFARQLAGADAAVSLNGQEPPRLAVLDVWPAEATLRRAGQTAEGGSLADRGDRPVSGRRGGRQENAGLPGTACWA